MIGELISDNVQISELLLAEYGIDMKYVQVLSHTSGFKQVQRFKIGPTTFKTHISAKVLADSE